MRNRFGAFSISCFAYKEFIRYLFFLEARIAISLGFYNGLLHFLEQNIGALFYDFAGVEIMKLFCYSFCDKMLQNAFW